MSAPKFTPGPWEVEDRCERLLIWSERASDSEDSIEVCVVNVDDESDAAGEDAAGANAALISAAPDLLEVAQVILDAANDHELPLMVRGKLEAAIRKARGGA